METLIGSLGGGIAGAVIKLLAGLLMLWFQNRQADRDERTTLAGKQIAAARMARAAPNEYFSFTRRVLAWTVTFTFCGICLLWAIWPGYPIVTSGGDRGTSLNLLLFTFSVNRDLGVTLTTGAIVWQLIPFLSMILMTYFTPDVSKIR